MADNGSGNGKQPTQEVEYYICPKGHEGGSGMTFYLTNIPGLDFPHGIENRYCMACILADAIKRLKLKPLKKETRRVPIETEQEEG